MQWRRTWPLMLGIAVTIFWSVANRRIANDFENPPKSSPLSHVPVSLVSPHLTLADDRIREATRNHFGPIANLLDQSRSQAAEFAATALGWGSKWRIAVDSVPFTNGGRNEKYLKEQFERQVLKGEQLQKAIGQSVTEFIADIHDIESQMLVDLRADIENFSREYKVDALDGQELRSLFNDAIANAMQVANTDLQSNISSQLVSIVVGEVLTQVAIRLGVSAGILGTGAASGWATLGIGIIVGIVIDQIVMTIWSHWNDPKGQLIDTLKHQLNVVQDMICLGDNQTKGLVKHFEQIAESRSSLRRAAVFEILGIKDESLIPSWVSNEKQSTSSKETQ